MTSENDPLIFKSEDGEIEGTAINKREDECNSAYTWSKDRSLPQNDSFVIMVLLLSAMIGSGILSQPYCFAQSGIALVLVLYILVGLLVWVATISMIAAAEKANTFTYTSLCVAYLGEAGGYLSEVAIILGIFSSQVSYVITIGILASQVLLTFVPDTTPFNKFVLSPQVDASALVICLIVPPCLVKHFGHLNWVAQASILFVIVVLIFICISGPYQPTYYFNKHPFGDVTGLNWWSWNGMIDSLGCIIFTLQFGISIFPAFESMSPRDTNLLNTVVLWTILAGILLCALMGIAGYLAFMGETNGNILFNFTSTEVWSFANFFKVLIMLHLCLYIPLGFVLMRDTIFKLLGWKDEEISELAFVNTTMLSLMSILALSIYLIGEVSQAFIMMLSLSGGVCYSFVIFIIPGLIAIMAFCDHATDDENKVLMFYFWSGTFNLLFGLAVFTWSIVQIFLTPPQI